MIKYLLVFVAFLLLLSSTHAVAQEGPGKAEGKAIEADGLKSVATLSINGIQFDDFNRNAIFDAGERGLSGWVIRLKLDDVEISNTTTDASGRYYFTNLGPGNYTVTEDQQAGWEQSVPGSEGYTINLSDKSAYKVNFGSSRFSGESSENDVGANVPGTTYDDDKCRYPVMPITPELLEDWPGPHNESA